MQWTPELIESVRARYMSGESAKAIGEDIGMSRSAVIGKMHREGFRKLPSKPGRVKSTAVWTPERVEALREMVNGTLTNAQIGDRLGGFSGDAITTKMRRLGLSRPAHIIEMRRKQRVFKGNLDAAGRRTKPTAEQEAQIKAQRAALPDKMKRASEANPDARHAMIETLKANQCRWPVSEWKGNHLFCGCETAAGESYCAQHKSIAYRAPYPWERQAS